MWKTEFIPVMGRNPSCCIFLDDVQLPPVCDCPVYKGNNKSMPSMHGTLVWKEFDTAVLLNTVFRQGEKENQFKNVLSSLREYKLSPEQAIWLQQFQWDDLKRAYGPQFIKNLNDQGLFVFPTHNEEWLHNKDSLLAANEKSPIAKINVMSKGSHSMSAAENSCGNLSKTLYVCVGCKVMLTTNLNIKYGLFNGSTGIIVDIIYPPNKFPQDCQPTTIMVEFNKYTGPLLQWREKLIVLVMVARESKFLYV